MFCTGNAFGERIIVQCLDSGKDRSDIAACHVQERIETVKVQHDVEGAFSIAPMLWENGLNDSSLYAGVRVSCDID